MALHTSHRCVGSTAHMFIQREGRGERAATDEQAETTDWQPDRHNATITGIACADCD
jgi:hypothetical protein